MFQDDPNLAPGWPSCTGKAKTELGFVLRFLGAVLCLSWACLWLVVDCLGLPGAPRGFPACGCLVPVLGPLARLGLLGAFLGAVLWLPFAPVLGPKGSAGQAQDSNMNDIFWATV